MIQIITEFSINGFKSWLQKWIEIINVWFANIFILLPLGYLFIDNNHKTVLLRPALWYAPQFYPYLTEKVLLERTVCYIPGVNPKLSDRTDPNERCTFIFLSENLLELNSTFSNAGSELCATNISDNNLLSSRPVHLSSSAEFFVYIGFLSMFWKGFPRSKSKRLTKW